MSKKYDVVATVGRYEKDGQTKYITRNVGSVIQTQKGFRLALDASFNPAGCKVEEDGKVWLALFEPKPRDNQQGGYGNTDQQRDNYSQNYRPADQGGGFGGGQEEGSIPF